MNLPSLDNGWTAGRYAWFRIALGVYLAAHFIALIPWAAELFSSAGMLPVATDSPIARVFPNILGWFDHPMVATAMAVVGAAASVALALGRGDRAAAVVAWYVLACFFGRNPLIGNPSLPYVGLLLLTHALVAPRRGSSPRWQLPGKVFAALWIAMAVGYSYSGIMKLGSPSWLDGSALAHVLENPLARPSALRDFILGLPPLCLKLATWGTLGLEIAFAPLALSRRLRPALWVAMVGLHVGLVVLIDFADLSVGMLLLHAFTFDPRWLQRSGNWATIVPGRGRA